MKIGLLIPYSGEFPGLKRTLVNSVSDFTKTSGHELVTEYIGNGSGNMVSKSIDKLFYNDDVDVIIGYVGYRVITDQFGKISQYHDKFFIHISLGEVIPYSASKVHYPANYCLLSTDAWRSIAFLGKWLASTLPAENCLICTSLYDAGYSLTEAFRIGYHSETAKILQSCLLKNEPKVFDVSPLFDEIRRIRPQHLHITLCGRELDSFIALFETQVSYTPSVSFAFPVAVKNRSAHPSLQHTFSAIKEEALPPDIQLLAQDPFAVLFGHLAGQAITILQEKTVENTPVITILETDLKEGTIYPYAGGTVPDSFNPAFNDSAEQAVSIWQNPYLCI